MVVHDLGPLPIVFPAVAPDLAVVPAVAGTRRGVEAWRLAHRLALPLVAIACSLLALLAVRILIADPGAFEAARRVPLVTYTAGITWLAHLALDRALGVTEPAARR